MIFFDLDDTLLNHEAASRVAAIDLYNNIEIAKPMPEFLEAWHGAAERHYSRYYAGDISFQEQRRERLREVVDSALTDEDADRIFKKYLGAYEDNWALFDDVLPCFERLSTNRLGLITNGDGQTQRRKLEMMGITDKFDCILISGECGYAKPNKEIFMRACKLAGVEPKDTIHVGDRHDLDAQGAQNAGLRGIWLNRKTPATTDHSQPIITSLIELSDFINTGNQL